MANTNAIWQQAAHTTFYHLLVLAAQQEPYKKSLTLNEKYLSFLEKSRENGPLG